MPMKLEAVMAFCKKHPINPELIECIFRNSSKQEHHVLASAVIEANPLDDAVKNKLGLKRWDRTLENQLTIFITPRKYDLRHFNNAWLLACNELKNPVVAELILQYILDHRQNFNDLKPGILESTEYLNIRSHLARLEFDQHFKNKM